MPSFTSVYEDTSPFFSYSNGWNPGSSADSSLSDYSDSSFHGTDQNNAFMSFQYYGTRVSIVGARRPNHGRFQVTVDQTNYPEANGRADPNVFKDTLFTQSLTQALHTVQLVNKEAAWLDVDQISWSTEIGTSDEELIVNTVQDSHPSWVYEPADGWSTSFPEAGSFSGRGGHGTSRQEATAQLSFTGDCIALFGGVGPSAAPAYSVQVDNNPATRYNANQPYARSHQLLFWAGGLGAGNHTIRVRMDSPVANQMLMLDYAEVYTTESLGGSWEGGPGTAGASGGTSSSSSSTGLIAGIAVVSALAGLALIALLFLFLRTRRQRRNAEPAPSSHIPPQSTGEPKPYDTHSIQPFVTGGTSHGNYSNSHVPYMGSATSGNTISSGALSPTPHGQHGGYPVGMMSVVNGRSDGEAASSSGTAASYQQGHMVTHTKATEAARHRSAASEAPPAYNPGD